MALKNQKTTALICELTENPEIVASEKTIITHTLLTCLSEATQRDFGLIIIHFHTRPISARAGIIALCSCLKNNSLTGQIPLFALMHTLHRDVIVRMKHAGVSFMNISSPEQPIYSKEMLSLIRRDDPSIRIGSFAAKLCPFLNYNPIDDRVELITCRAYRNRMVLGGKRLHDICETENHLHCEYYQNPIVTK